MVVEPGLEYLTFNERQSKTRQGVNPKDVHTLKPKMWANSETPDRCPVAIYKSYKEKRPQDFSRPDDPFYLATHTKQHLISISMTTCWCKQIVIDNETNGERSWNWCRQKTYKP
jgi:hypothetical protein